MTEVEAARLNPMAVEGRYGGEDYALEEVLVAVETATRVRDWALTKIID